MACVATTFIPIWIEIRNHDQYGAVEYRIVVNDPEDFDWYYARAKAARRVLMEGSYYGKSEYPLFCGGYLDGMWVVVPEKTNRRA